MYKATAVLVKPDGRRVECAGYGPNPHEAAEAAVLRVVANTYVEPGDRIEVDDVVELNAGD